MNDISMTVEDELQRMQEFLVQYQTHPSITAPIVRNYERANSVLRESGQAEAADFYNEWLSLWREKFLPAYGPDRVAVR